MTKVKTRQQSARKRQTARIFSALQNLIPKRKSAVRAESAVTNAHNGPDKLLLRLVVVMCLFGWIMIYSGSFYLASQRTGTLFQDHNPYHFFILQGVWIVAGTIAAYIIYRLPFVALQRLALPALLACIVLLIIVLVIPGEINGAKLWIKLGPFSLQPSEFSKPAMILALSAAFAKLRSAEFKTFGQYFEKMLLPFALLAGSVMVLVFMGKDLASAAVVGGIAMLIFAFANHSKIHHYFTIGLVIIGILGGAALSVSANYRRDRVNTYLEFLQTGEVPNRFKEGFQLNQILIAVGSGGFSGSGFGQSKQKYLYLQETAFSDTIFAVIAEEFGFLGSALVVVGYLILLLRSLKLAQNAPSQAAHLTALGITGWLFLQTIIHLGVNVGLIPLTGITLPFMSYGGSSVLSCLIGVGILLNISKQVK